jgi:hypothetical protein
MIEELEYFFDDIDTCECIGNFEDEYVYDIEMDDETHTFIANDILVHNSIFVGFKPAIKAYNWKHDPLEFVLFASKYRLQPFFKEKLDEHASKYLVTNVQDFELEQVSKSIINITKKMYIKNVVWEEGVFSEPETDLQPKGIKLVRSDTPAFIRDKKFGVYKIMSYFFKNPETMNDRELNKIVREMKAQFELAPIEDISMSTGCNNYNQKVLDDQESFKIVKGAHFGVKGAALHNYLLNQNPKYKQKYKLIKGGQKIRYYYTDNTLNGVFAYVAGSYPKEVAMKYAPINYDLQFEKCALNFINSFTEVLGLSELNPSLTFRCSVFP